MLFELGTQQNLRIYRTRLQREAVFSMKDTEWFSLCVLKTGVLNLQTFFDILLSKTVFEFIYNQMVLQFLLLN